MSEEKVLEILTDLCSALESAAVDAKRRIAELTGMKEPQAVREETFSVLKFEPQKGSRLGDFEVSSRQINIPEKFEHAYNVLKQSNSTISNRYHGPNYVFAYWIYGEVIYRQKLKGKEPEPKPEVDVLASTRALFPKELEDILTFEVAGEYIAIKPREYLGSEKFVKIAAIVREAGGEYLSAGKESHFRVPRK